MSSTSESSETLQPIEIVAREFNHINSASKELTEDKYFGPILKSGGGVCWAVSMSMALSALSGEDSADILHKVSRVTYDYFPKHLADIQDELRRLHGVEGAPPLIENGISGLVSRQTGGLSSFYMDYPRQTTNLFQYLIEAEMGISGIKVEIPPKATLVSDYAYMQDLAENFGQNSLPIIGVELDIHHKDSGVDERSGHMMLVSGVEKLGGYINRIRLSDVNAKKPVWLGREALVDFNTLGLIYRDNSKQLTRAQPDEFAPLIWFKKE